MNPAMQYNDDMIRITVLSFMDQEPLLVDLENNDDIMFHTISVDECVEGRTEHDVEQESDLSSLNLVQSDLVVVVYQQAHVDSVGYRSRKQIIDDNYIATIWLNLDELNNYHRLAAFRFINHMATMLNQNNVLKFNISDISSLISNSKSLRFLEADCEDLAIVIAANDSSMGADTVKSIIPDAAITDSAAMIIVTKEPISIRKINAGFDVINQVCEHKIPCYYGVHISPKYRAKHTYLYLVGER
ncbi:hypothetical protein [Moritella sp. Urea-trap-13]|uniref:hypothetical protein n=1 Tax=Moritella sp. Urea-trap-13 TaxID=2058327 RepID=UPI000C32E63E|nr:hypothetical protein [Moritella sp. Urea-trap-13]PKH07023.1 hypothetical protein CXF93_14200 [Moritella sp. Urea-trap-13]